MTTPGPAGDASGPDRRARRSLRVLGHRTWTELWDAPRRPLVAVPVGSFEQHGPHLPLDTDTRIATALADGLVAAFDPGEVMLGPAITVAASGEHQGFPGTLSIGTAATEQLLVELGRSADWSAGVVLVNGHGGNVWPVHEAVRILTLEGRRVHAWWPRIPDGDAHAGETETSLWGASAPAGARRARLEAGNTTAIDDLSGALRRDGVRAVSANGVLGDPRRADAGRGRALLTRLTIDLVAAVDEWWE